MLKIPAPPDAALDDLLLPVGEDICRDCPPDRVCAWACRQGMGATDNALAAMLGLSPPAPIDPDDEFFRAALCDCYN